MNSTYRPGYKWGEDPTALGARVIEKHVTLHRADGGPDSGFSLEPEELADLVRVARTAWQALGSVREEPRESEATQRPLRRSLYIAQDMEAGDVLTAENLWVVRPGYGLAPLHYKALLGREIGSAVGAGEPISWEMLG